VLKVVAMSATAPVPARTRLRALLKSGNQASPPLFLPLAHAVAAQVEALELHGFLTNATKLAKGLEALHQILEVDGITCFCSAGAELEALGAELDWSSNPPSPRDAPFPPQDFDADAIAQRVRQLPRVAAATEATRRLGAVCRGEPVLSVAIAGPAATAQAFADDSAAGSTNFAGATLLERAGRTVFEFARQFLAAGANLIVLLENDISHLDSDGVETWRAAVAPIANLSRFHKAVPVMLCNSQVAATDKIPSSFILCQPPSIHSAQVEARAKGLALSPRPADWQLPSQPFSILTTAGEICPETDLGLLRTACANIRSQAARDHSSGSP
jgi:uroporphyrinogen-III decarboxylase